MNSNRVIEIDKARCNSCLKVYYEFKDYELDECPHCNKSLKCKYSYDIELTMVKEIEIDFNTGQVKII